MLNFIFALSRSFPNSLYGALLSGQYTYEHYKLVDILLSI